MNADEVFSWYKRRWRIKTFYNYFVNRKHNKAVMMQDYCKMQGLAFILLVSSLIHTDVVNELEQMRVRQKKAKRMMQCVRPDS